MPDATYLNVSGPADSLSDVKSLPDSLIYLQGRSLPEQSVPVPAPAPVPGVGVVVDMENPGFLQSTSGPAWSGERSAGLVMGAEEIQCLQL